MLKRISTIAGGSILAMVVLFPIAGRSISELLGYFRAGASTAVKSIESEVPDVVHDEKAAMEFATARERLIDRQVQLNLSQNQLKNLEHEIIGLQKAIAERTQVLASAYPLLKNAGDGDKSKVTFVSTNYSIEEFQQEIDNLLSMQDRDENSLRIKQAAYDRLQKSVTDGESALVTMKNAMLDNEQEFAILKTRRDQARMEADTLDLVAGTATTHSTTSEIGKSIDRLHGQVEQLEARNAARRDVAPASERVRPGKLSQSLNRLDALKKYSNKDGESTGNTYQMNRPAKAELTKPEIGTKPSTSVDTEEVVFHISGDETENLQKALL